MIGLDELVRQIADEYDAAVERAVEAAVQGGECGVLVVERERSSWSAADAVSLLGGYEITVSPEVPYGWIYVRQAQRRPW